MLSFIGSVIWRYKIKTCQCVKLIVNLEGIAMRIDTLSRSLICINCLLLLALFTTATSAQCLKPSDERQLYLNGLQSKCLSNFLPPKGDWAFSDGVVEAILLGNGHIERAKVTKHLLNRGKPSKYGDQSLLLAISRSSPADAPPASIKCPTRIVVKFLVKSRLHGGYRCVIQLADLKGCL